MSESTPTLHWSCTRDADDIAWLVIDRHGAPANSLSAAVMTELDGLLQGLALRPPRGVVILSGKASGFIAGADIGEFRRDIGEAEALALIEGGQGVLDRLEALPCPTVAAIHGFCLGGGLEVALACRYRIATEDSATALGLPEVNLGIHPGFGGTVRAPALLGIRAAMPLMLEGKTLRADKALRIGLVDRVVPADALRSTARELVLTPPLPRRAPWLDRVLGWPLVRGWFAGQVERRVAARVRREHYPAPYAIVDLWRRTAGRGVAAYRAEAKSIAHLFTTPTSRNLVRVFFLQTRLKALGSGSALPGNHVHVVGAGVMGGDIAALCAWRGMEVTLQDREQVLVD
ncbi:MAG: enoyl-CoA hydratase-related protein, partial [Gammaproteobacteria bacterium]